MQGIQINLDSQFQASGARPPSLILPPSVSAPNDWIDEATPAGFELPPMEERTWEPLKGSQFRALQCPADVILFDGTRGPGKSDCQLMRFRARVGMGYGMFWRGVIFDREYKNLDDLISKSLRWFPQIKDGARFLRSASDYKWVWPTGEELMFRAIKKMSDYWGYHGQEFPFIGWNELTKFPTDELFELLMSCNRSSFIPSKYPLTIDGDVYNKTGQIVIVNRAHKTATKHLLPEIPLEVFATTNPYGVGHNWVKKRFVSVAPAGKIVSKITRVFNPRTQKEEDIERTQCRIFGSYRENIHLSPQYIAELHSIKDPNKRKAWLGGDWDIVSGGMFDDVWNKKHHVVKPFDIPRSWKIDRAFDWGSSKPFSVGWWAESDGTDIILPDGKRKSTVKGDLFRIAEWYGTSGKVNEGLRLTATKITEGIIERELDWKIYGRVWAGPADNSIFDMENDNDISRDMRKAVRVRGKRYKGVRWTRSDKASGSRRTGWEKMRLMLQNSIPNTNGTPREYPGLFIFEYCVHFIDIVPVLARDEKDPDDIDSEAEDHIADETRYKLLAGGRKVKSSKTVGLGG
jgi:hypothetical protein